MVFQVPGDTVGQLRGVLLVVDQQVVDAVIALVEVNHLGGIPVEDDAFVLGLAKCCLFELIVLLTLLGLFVLESQNYQLV